MRSLLSDRSGSHLMQKLIDSATNASFDAVVRQHFLGSLLELSRDLVANFCVQSVLQRFRPHAAAAAIDGTEASASVAVEEHALLNDCFDELRDSIGALFEAKRGTVVFRLVEACGRLGQRLKDCISAVARGVGVNNASENRTMVERLLVQLQSEHSIRRLNLTAAATAAAASAGTDGAEAVSKDVVPLTTSYPATLSVPGSQIVQCFLRSYPSNLCRVVHESVAAIAPELLLRMARDAAGAPIESSCSVFRVCSLVLVM